MVTMLQPTYPGGKWQLNHPKGTELVADGMTKPLAGQCFFGFLSDLGLQGEQIHVKRVTMGNRHLQVHDRSVALQAIVGGAIVQAAQAAEALLFRNIVDPRLSPDCDWGNLGWEDSAEFHWALSQKIAWSHQRAALSS